MQSFPIFLIQDVAKARGRSRQAIVNQISQGKLPPTHRASSGIQFWFPHEIEPFLKKTTPNQA